MEVKVRGRWKSESNLNRYMKPARAQATAQEVPSKVLAYGSHIKSMLKEMLLHGAPVPKF
eukprot:3593876-Karenia_brevis.AAC.1